MIGSNAEQMPSTSRRSIKFLFSEYWRYMMTSPTSLVAIGLLAFSAQIVHSQQLSLPAELSGRWTFASAGRTNTFSLDQIKPATDKSFTAVLTWWTSDPACTIRKEPITGRLTAGGIAFDAKTKCDVEFTTELARGEKEWVGSAITKGTNSVTLEVRAK
jgi:hypothetical protein